MPGFWGPRGGTAVLNVVPMPNRKSDTNNHHYCFTSSDWAEANYDYPEAGPDRRLEIAAAHRAYTEGLVWFCQHDEDLPADFRKAAREWGPAADEFEDNGGFPRQMYVREGCRILGGYLFSASDALLDASGWALADALGQRGVGRLPDRFARDAAARGTGAWRLRGGGRTAGGAGGVYRTAGGDCAVSDSVPGDGSRGDRRAADAGGGVGQSPGLRTIRMEPVWMALGEAAGTAASLALERAYACATCRAAGCNACCWLRVRSLRI